MKIPTLDDFKTVQHLFSGYYTYQVDEHCELVLTPCLFGYDIRLYDENRAMLCSEVCTMLPVMHTSLDAYEAALPIYTKMLKQYEQDTTNRQSSTGEPDNHRGQQ